MKIIYNGIQSGEIFGVSKAYKETAKVLYKTYRVIYPCGKIKDIGLPVKSSLTIEKFLAKNS